METTKTLALILKTDANDEVVSLKVHSVSCPFVTKATEQGRDVVVDTERTNVREEIGNWKEQGVKVSYCKCSK